MRLPAEAGARREYGLPYSNIYVTIPPLTGLRVENRVGFTYPLMAESRAPSAVPTCFAKFVQLLCQRYQRLQHQMDYSQKLERH